jgi:aryl-alcohol dehydrogenase-like predicted oxidoreductase
VRGMEWIRDRLVGDEAAKHIDKVRRLKDVSDDLGCTRAQLALAWCLKNPHVSSVITGATSPEQVEENMKAPDVAGKLKRPVMDRIEKILNNKPELVPDYRKS